MTKSKYAEMAEDIATRSPRPAQREDVEANTPNPPAVENPPAAAAAQPQAGLTDSQRLLVEQRVTNERPSTAAAYVLDIFFGPLGLHRFYLGETGTGLAMLILSITVVGLIISGPWAFIDLFLIPGMIRRRTEALRHKYTVEILSGG